MNNTKNWRKKGSAVCATLAITGAVASCGPQKQERLQYASSFSDAWQGRSLRLEGVSKIPCVQYSTTPGSCIVFKRNDDKTVEKHTGTCEVEGSYTGKYVSVNCRNGNGPCVPGDNKIVINLNAANKLQGDEPNVADSSLARRIVALEGTCEQAL